MSDDDYDEIDALLEVLGTQEKLSIALEALEKIEALIPYQHSLTENQMHDIATKALKQIRGE